MVALSTGRAEISTALRTLWIRTVDNLPIAVDAAPDDENAPLPVGLAADPTVGGSRPWPGGSRRRVDRVVPTALAGAVVAVLGALHAALGRPLWYDEIWRPHFLAEPAGTFWSELAHANTPSALGWAALTRLVGDVAGWHAWALRGPELVALVLLPVAVYAFVRRFTGAVAAGLAGASVGLSGVIVDLGTQLKPYSIEALASLAIVWLWTAQDAARTDRGAGFASGRPWLPRTLAGVVGLFSVPAAFLVIPLAAVDVLTAGRRWRHRLAAAFAAAPALAICGLHTALFVGHQSSQRASTFWDTQFLAGRGPLDAVRFVAGETVWILGGAPTGVDRYDPNLVHPATDTTLAAAWLIAPAAAVAFVVGPAALARRRDGRHLLGAVVGALLLALVASAGRYWPFGANRTNLFLVPLLVAVVAVGADRLAGRGTRRGAWRGASAASRAASVATLAVAVVLAATPVASASALAPLWRDRAEIRPVALMVDATTLTRRLYQPGDVVVVGGRLARSGWLYAMGVSDDGVYAAAPRAVPAGAAAGRWGVPARVGPRLPADSTVFLTQVGAGEAATALAGRPDGPPRRVLLFVLTYDRAGAAAELADLRTAGWCPATTFDFPNTGALYVLTHCG